MGNPEFPERKHPRYFRGGSVKENGQYIHNGPGHVTGIWETLGTLQGHSKCSEFSSFLDVSLQCPQSFLKNYQKWYIMDEIIRTF